MSHSAALLTHVPYLTAGRLDLHALLGQFVSPEGAMKPDTAIEAVEDERQVVQSIGLQRILRSPYQVGSIVWWATAEESEGHAEPAVTTRAMGSV